MAETVTESLCGSCGQQQQKCQACNLYICLRCINEDHLANCKSYQICSEESRHFLKTTRNVQDGEVILSESFVVVSPVKSKNGLLPCVGCCRLGTESNCPDCLWPACSPNCEALKNETKHRVECQILKLQKTDSFRYDILLPLRILLLQRFNPEEWQKLTIQAEAFKETNIHESRKQTLEFLEKNYLQPFRKTEEENIIFSENSKSALYKILCHLKTISYENGDVSVEVVHPIFNLIEHCCTPNSIQTLDTSFKLVLRANSLISPNTHITVSNTDLFEGTSSRLANLKKSNTNCNCARCSDPTEFGTYFSALRCLGAKNKPCGGNQLPEKPTADETVWKCDNCDLELPSDQMLKFVQHLGGEVLKILHRTATVDELEEFLAKLLMFLHPNHFYVCKIKWQLVKLYENDLVSTKIDLCKGLLDMACKFYPNGGLFLQELLFKLCQAKVEFFKIKDDKNKNDVDEIAALFKEMKKSFIYDGSLFVKVNLEEKMFDELLKQLSIDQ